MSNNILAVDVMSGDFGPTVLVPSCVDFLKQNSRAKLILVGNDKMILDILGNDSPYLKSGRIQVQFAGEVVESDDKPSVALRKKKDSSMRVAIDLVKQGKAGACVSSGNTGALVSIAKFVLKTLPTISRPAIVARFPNPQFKSNYLLDAGASLVTPPEQLLQFAIMGHFMAKLVAGVETPRIGLLNVGQEEIKGDDDIKTTAALLDSAELLHYIGFVEGNDIVSNRCDVIVTNGFSGNIGLKAVEGTAAYFLAALKNILKSGLYFRFLALLLKPVLSRLFKHVGPRQFNGASILGLKGVVIKSHGGADFFCFW